MCKFDDAKTERLFDAKRGLLEADERYAKLVKSKLERTEFAKTVLTGLLMAPIKKELTREMVCKRFGERFGFTEEDITLDFDNMLCTIKLNEVTTARIGIVDRPGRHDVRPGVFATRHKRPEVEPLPTPEEETEAVKMRREYPELIEKCRREMAEAARAAGSVFTEFLEGKCFYANVRLDGGEVVPLSPELIEELLENEYIYVRREDVRVDLDHWLVTVKGAGKFNITNLTGDKAVLCDRPKRWKGDKDGMEAKQGEKTAPDKA